MKTVIAVVCDSFEWDRACQVLQKLPGERLVIARPALGFHKLNAIVEECRGARVTHCIIIPEGIVGNLISALRGLLTQSNITSEVARSKVTEVTLRDNRVEELINIIEANHEPELVIHLTSQDEAYWGKVVLAWVKNTQLVFVALRRDQNDWYMASCHNPDEFVTTMRETSSSSEVTMAGDELIATIRLILITKGIHMANNEELESWIRAQIRERMHLTQTRRQAAVR